MALYFQNEVVFVCSIKIINDFLHLEVPVSSGVTREEISEGTRGVRIFLGEHQLLISAADTRFSREGHPPRSYATAGVADFFIHPLIEKHRCRR